MLMPSIFRENLLDDFMDSAFSTNYSAGSLMKTDVKEKDGNYELTMDLPGVKKEDVHAELKDGYLTVSASVNNSKDEKDEAGNYIRRERYSGSASRSFYVGQAVRQEDIKAKFENGTVKFIVPKEEEKKAVDDKHYIAIEG
ncbi:MAG: Hsp20/alpha crystallin family protein [Lachnospiraceae bacterium]|nr:Hsp20/alpha crystallin family protein [Lachnospiraceae bacterium]